MDHSRLRKLPPEIRNYIWDLALRNGYGDCYASSPRRGLGYLACDHDHPLALTQACSAIRQETRLNFFALNDFVFESNPESAESKLWRFLSLIGKDNEKVLQDVRIRTARQRKCLCCTRDPEHCPRCKNFLAGLREVYGWSVKHGGVKLTVELASKDGSLHFSLDLEHLFTSPRVNTPMFLEYYEYAYTIGVHEGFWGNFERYGLTRPPNTYPRYE